MSIGSYIFFTLLIMSAVIILAVSSKTGKPFRCIFLSAFSGLGALFGVNILSAVTAVSLPLNALTLLISGVGGIPGVVFLLLCDVILHQ